MTSTAAGDAMRRTATPSSATPPIVPSRPTDPRPRVVEPRRPRLTYRRDIDGLRAVAVVLVVAFHAGLGVVPGGFVGVDVFFVISGFLITGLLVDELDRSGTVSLPGFYARRMRRLLPLSALVLVVTAIAASVILPPLTHASVADDVRAAAVWVSNWHFAAGSTQYMSDTAQSPVLHYWSLSLEEQFYVVWPLVMLGVLWSVGRWGPMARRRLGTALGVILVVSLLASMTLTSATGPWAYFGLQTRAWELAVGAGLSLVVARLTELTLPVAALAGWIGLALIAWSAFTFDRTTAYPGIAAVVPVGGAALVLASGARMRGAGASGLLSHPGVVHVGKLSYSWYLWHWPLLVLAAALAPAAGADTVDGSPARTPLLYVVVALVLSYALAEISHRYVEDPVRRSALFTSSVSRSLTLGAALTVTSVLIANAALGTVDAPPSTATVAPVVTTKTGVVTLPSSAPTATPAKPLHPMTPAQARLDGASSTTCFVGYAATAADGSCRFGDPKGTKVVALVGDSHAAMWLPALDKVAKTKHWQVRMWAKSACPMTEVAIYLASYKATYDACTAWRSDVLRRLAEIPHLDLVVVARSKGYVSGLVLDGTGSVVSDSALPAAWRAGTRDLLTRLTSLARRVVLVRDTPWAFGDVPDCLSAHLTDPTSCAFPTADRQHLDDPMVSGETQAMAGLSHVRMVDPTALVCPQDTCQVVSPTGVIVYRDGHHLTRTFATTLAAGFGKLLAPSLGA